MKDIKNYEGIYAVTEDGKVWSYRSNRFLNPSKHYRGYQVVCLSVNGKAESFFVHRLVAEAYIPNPDNLPCVNHLDENPENSCVENLEWCTHTYNINYGTAMKRASRAKGKLTFCVELDKQFFSTKEAAQYIGVSKNSIQRCCKNTHYTSGGYHWRYINE